VDVSDLLTLLANWGECPDPGPGTVYTELNYIDPPMNDCSEALCTNGITGVVSQRSPHETGYFSPATIWTQSQTGVLHTVRVIVFGYEDWVNQEGAFVKFEDFEQHGYELEIWNGFDSYAANPGQGDIIIGNIWPPVSHAQKGENYLGDPTFEWVFDFSEHEIELQHGQEYVLMLRAVGHFPQVGSVLRSASAWPGGPDVHATDAIPAQYMDQPPLNWSNPRLGTEIRILVP
jgi:hypothetical protein